MDINTSKIACAFLTSKLRLELVATQYNITNAECYIALNKFCRTHPQSHLVPHIKRKLKLNIISSFLSYRGSREVFAEEYGIPERKLIETIYEAIDDYTLLTHDVLADRLFRKLTQDKVFCVASLPKRIVKIIGVCYANSGISQAKLASSYGTRDSSISSILRRGISEGIFDEALANKVYAKVRNCKYVTIAMMKAYDAAFDKRANLKQS